MNMVKRYTVLLAALVIALLSPRLAAAEPVGTFTKIEGSVDILRQSDTAVVRVRVGDAVSLGDAVRTKRDGKAEITFRDETAIQLAPETRITIDEYTYRADSSRERGLIGLFRGKVRAIVSKIKAAVIPVSRTDAGFNIKTATAIAGVKGTDFIVYYERGITGVIFIEGQGFVYNPVKPDKVVPVRSGQATFVMGGDQAPLNAQPVSGSFVAPHLKDMPGGAGAEQPEGGQGPTVAVFADNTTYGALTGAVAGGDGGVFGLPEGTGPLIIPNPDAPTPKPTYKPITEAYPALLPTPVNLSVTIP
jgi:hypothetical protein